MTQANPSSPITVEQAIPMAATGDLVLVDLREPAEIAASGAAEGALRIPLATLRMRADPTSPDFEAAFKSGKPIALYCAAGGRAGQGKQLLESFGIENVHNIGGLTHWATAGGPIVR
jgi:rhodanese-related sulfurtransferase